MTRYSNPEKADSQGNKLVNFVYSNWKYFAFYLVLFYLHFLIVWLLEKHPFGITFELSNPLLQIWMDYLLKYEHFSLSQKHGEFQGKK